VSDIEFAALISKIAHELRSPLTSVKGFSSTLVTRWDRFTDEQRKQFVETIHADAERMGRIIAEVLDLARMESGRLELHRTRAHVRSVAERAASNLGELAGSERIVIDVDDGLFAWADVERLEHVLTNLLENAVKFSDDGPITVTAQGADGMVTIAVHDEGVGIPGDRLARVFDGPSPSGGRATPLGTGLGLYLSRRLAEAHGGSIAASSEEGEWSTFSVILPAEKEAEAT
jgi:signal transduction histidine kinase